MLPLICVHILCAFDQQVALSKTEDDTAISVASKDSGLPTEVDRYGLPTWPEQPRHSHTHHQYSRSTTDGHHRKRKPECEREHSTRPPVSTHHATANPCSSEERVTRTQQNAEEELGQAQHSKHAANGSRRLPQLCQRCSRALHSEKVPSHRRKGSRHKHKPSLTLDKVNQGTVEDYLWYKFENWQMIGEEEEHDTKSLTFSQYVHASNSAEN